MNCVRMDTRCCVIKKRTDVKSYMEKKGCTTYSAFLVASKENGIDLGAFDCGAVANVLAVAAVVTIEQIGGCSLSIVSNAYSQKPDEFIILTMFMWVGIFVMRRKTNREKHI